MSSTLEIARRFEAALRRIAAYDSPEKIRKHSQRLYGLPADEAIEYAYDNVRQEAKQALRGLRMPKAQP